MKAEHINPFLLSTSNVFNTMVGIEPKKLDVYLKEPEEKFAYDISGVIGLAGEANGYVTISMPEELAFTIVENFVGEKKSEIDEDVTDAIGEILNMIAGGAKQAFSEMGLRFKISIPNVITGKEHSIARKSDIPSIVIRYGIDDKEFIIEAALVESDKG